MAEYRLVPLYKTAEQIEKQLKEAQEFLKKYPLPPRRDPKDVIQAASTQRLLDMTDTELEEYRNRALPTEDQWKRDHTAQGDWTIDQAITLDGLRRSGRHIAHDTDLKSASDDRKELARQAFTCTPPASLSEKEIEKLTELNKITEYKGPVSEEKVNLLDKIKSWFKSYAPTQERKSYAEIQEILRKEKE